MSEIFEANRDQKLDQKLAAEDSAALSELDPIPESAPPTEIQVEVKPEVTPAPEVPVIPETKIEPEVDEIQRRLDEIQPKPNAHPNTAKGYRALKDIIVELKDKLGATESSKKETETKLASLETEYKGKVITPELEEEIKGLREHRRNFHIQEDPEFQAKYSTKLQDIDQRAIGILAASGMKPELQKFILDNGGVIAMANSTRQMPEGNSYSERTHQQFIENDILPKLPSIQRTRLESAIAAGMDLRDEMNREIEYAKTHGSELEQKRQKELQDLFMASALEERKRFGKKAEKWEILATDSKEEKVRKEKHNARVEKSEALFNEYLKGGDKNPAKVAEALVKASQSQYLMEEAEEKDAAIADLEKKNRELEERLEKIKGSGSTGKVTSAPAPDSKPSLGGKIESDEAALARF